MKFGDKTWAYRTEVTIVYCNWI